LCIEGDCTCLNQAYRLIFIYRPGVLSLPALFFSKTEVTPLLIFLKKVTLATIMNPFWIRTCRMVLKAPSATGRIAAERNHPARIGAKNRARALGIVYSDLL
jgi:hypothetical protein